MKRRITGKTKSWNLLNFSGINIILILGIIMLGLICFIRNKQIEQVRSKAFDGYIQQAAERYGMPFHLIKAIIWQESRFDPWAKNKRTGALGLMQLMNNQSGALAEWQQNMLIERPISSVILEPMINIDIGTWYFARAVKYWEKYYSNPKTIFQLALAEYNAGRLNAAKWRPKESNGELNLKNITFKETRHYVAVIMDYWEKQKK